jgi:gamma-glutamyltranspeptidase / glutathione hydrolase
MFTTRPELRGTFGMVSSTHWIASACGMATLEAGGNAFDAAVVAGFVLQIVEPHLNGPGGEVPIVGYDASAGSPFVIDGQGVAPRRATRDAFAERELDLIPGTDLLSACVPGAFGAWMLLLRDHGTLDPAAALRPAIGYARDGYPLVARIAATIANVADVFRTEWPSSAAVYLADGVPRPGALFSNPDLATTYERIAASSGSQTRESQIDAAVDAFYRGFVADAIQVFLLERDALLDGDDLATWQASEETPTLLEYGDLTICKPGPWTQGPVFLQQLSLLEQRAISQLPHNSIEFIHTVVECAKLAFADREAFYGDPKFVDVPMEALLSDRYAKERAALVEDRASMELRPGAPDGNSSRLPRVPIVAAGGAGAGEPTLQRGDTCHVCAVDRWGNAVAATPSGGWLQSSPVVEGLGFCLGTRAQMFWLEEGLPNSLEPGKRPRTTLSPTLALREGRAAVAFGTPGGDQQDQWQIPFFLAHVHGGLDLQAAIDAPNFHTEHFPSSFYPRDSHPGRVVVESRVGEGTVAALRKLGHEVVVSEAWSLGRLCAVGVEPDGTLKAGANPRGMQGYAVGR